MPTSVPFPRSPRWTHDCLMAVPAGCPLPGLHATRGCCRWDAHFCSVSTLMGSCVTTCCEGLSLLGCPLPFCVFYMQGIVSRHIALIQVTLHPKPHLDSDLYKRRHCSPFFPRAILFLFEQYLHVIWYNSKFSNTTLPRFSFATMLYISKLRRLLI